ncbi:MAG TPA: hypothetical protein VFL96_01500 [Acidobacteriaceae bacterium]|nr:hypothetical protein [Acidobacteriaceae bacterium]
MSETKFKVYGGTYDGRHRVIVAASSKKAAYAAICKVWPNISYYYWNGYTSDTGNKTELSVALSEPGTVFVAKDDYRHEFAPVRPPR